MPRELARALALAAMPFLAACASTGERYPSLAIRDVERAQGQFEPAPASPLDVPRVPTGATGPLADRLKALTARAAASHQAFTDAAPAATRRAAAAAGMAVGSPAWAAAQVALADLDSARSNTAITLADLDTLHIAAAVQAEELAAIEAARQKVLALVSDEDALLARLRAQVR